MQLRTKAFARPLGVMLGLLQVVLTLGLLRAETGHLGEHCLLHQGHHQTLEADANASAGAVSITSPADHAGADCLWCDLAVSGQVFLGRVAPTNPIVQKTHVASSLDHDSLAIFRPLGLAPKTSPPTHLG